MPLSGYFGIQDAIVVILCASMGFSILRRNPDDPTRWIPFNVYTGARWAVGIAVILVSVLTMQRVDSPPYYVISFAGALVFLAGAVFFYGAKSPMSSILVEDPEYGAVLKPKGLYRFVRHPLFFGLFLCAVGFPLYLLSIPGLVVSIAAAFPLLYYSSTTIDALWASRSGAAYDEYRAQVHLFIPSLKSAWKKETKEKDVQRI